jgi:hypothetical protein
MSQRGSSSGGAIPARASTRKAACRNDHTLGAMVDRDSSGG